MKYKALILAGATFVLFLGCSSKKNTRTTRAYHEINTRYNIYFNAEEAYKERLNEKQKGYKDNLSLLLDIYPVRETDVMKEKTGGAFDVTVDKTTKAIKLHSIKTKPERDPSKRKDIEYQTWLKQQEFNPFLKNVWLLLGKAEYQNEDYLQSISTLSYVTRLYKTDEEVVAEARIWIAKGYTAMGWFYEAEDTFHKIKISGGVPSFLQPEYDAVYADFMIKKKDYGTAIPYLEQAISSESDRHQRTRMRYLLGQLYAQQGEKAKSYEAFDKVMGMNTPYEFTFNAKIQQAGLADASNRTQILDKLGKMSRDLKNKDYLDQVYFAIGNVYLNQQDTVAAAENYRKAIEKSIRGGYDKAINQVQLGDIYFAQKDYVRAQPCYSEALAGLSKKHDIYPRVSLRSEVLDELVVYVKAVHLQDSLQVLSQMSEGDRMQAVNKIIADQKKADEEQRKEAERSNIVINDGNPNEPLFKPTTPNIPTSGPVIFNAGSSFYFYNKELVNSGKASFKQRWGNRKLEDDWRRRDKQVSIFADNSEVNIDDQNTKEINNSGDGLPDKYNPDFYLSQIPLTPEAIEASNEIIEDAFFNMGKIYNEKLGDYHLAIDAFETDLRRFPVSDHQEEIYYQLFLIYLRLGNHEMTGYYRNLLLKTFPKSVYALALSDPNYEWNTRNMHQLETDLYDKTYELYLAGKTAEVEANCAMMREKYPLSVLIPKFMFLNALSFAQRNDVDKFKAGLKELIDKYPKADVTELATAMLKEAEGGRMLASDSSPMRGMIWNMKLGNAKDGEETEGVDFVAKPDAEFMLAFLFQSKTVDKNQLIYEVASYNFSKFIYQTFDLSFSEANSLEILQVRGFKSFEDIISYIDMAFEKGSLMDMLPSSVIPIPISTDNYIALMNGRTLNEYFLFFEKNYTKEMIPLIMYWNKQRQKEPKTVEPEQTKIVEESENEIESVSPPVLIPAPKKESEQKIEEEKSIGVENILDEDQIERADEIIDKAKEIFDNPVEGLKNLLNSAKDRPKLSKEEKAAQKEEKKRLKEEEKRKKSEEKARIRAAEEADYARQDSIDATEKARADSIKSLKNKEREKQANEIKARQDARKQRQQELKAKEKARKELLKQREQERERLLKQRERERKEKLEQRKRGQALSDSNT